MVEPTNIGKMLKQRRKQLGVDQHTLAMLAQMSVNTIVAVERGTTDPSLSTINKLCDVLGLELIVRLKEDK